MDIYGGNAGKIGEYIHFNRQYYIASALKTRRGRRDIHWDPTHQLQEMHNSIISQTSHYGSWVHANELATKLNYQYGFKNKSINAKDLDKAERDMLEKAITDYLDDYEQHGLVLDMENLKFDYDGSQTGLGKGVSQYRMGAKKGKTYTKTNLNVLCKKVEGFLQIAQPKKAILSETQIQEINNLEAQWKSLKKELETVYQGQNISNLNKTIQLTDKTTGQRTAAGNIVDDLNKMLDQYRLGQAVQNGLLGEFVIPAILFMVENKGNSELQNIMNDFAKGFSAGKKGSQGTTAGGALSYKSVGGMGTKKALIQSNIAITMNEDFNNRLNTGNKFLQYTKEDGTGNLVSCTATQDKVDTVITYPDYTYNLSVKNYQTAKHSDISLHSGNLLRLIQQETDFINHFLNITSEREASGRSMTSEKKGEFNKNAISMAQRTMQELVLARGLVGGVFSDQGVTSQANQFVLNDSSNGHFYVIPMSAMINSGIGDTQNGIQVFYNGSKKAGDLKIKNTWLVKDDKKARKINSYNAAQARIKKMVIDFAKVNVSVKMNAEQIKRLRGR